MNRFVISLLVLAAACVWVWLATLWLDKSWQQGVSEMAQEIVWRPSNN